MTTGGKVSAVSGFLHFNDNSIKKNTIHSLTFELKSAEAYN